MSRLGRARHIILSIGEDAGLYMAIAILLAAFVGIAKTIPSAAWSTTYPPFNKLVLIAFGFYLWRLVAKFFRVNIHQICRKHGIAVIE